MWQASALYSQFFIFTRILQVSECLFQPLQLPIFEQVESPTLNHVAILFKIRLIFILLEVRVSKNKQNAYRKENFLVLYFS